MTGKKFLGRDAILAAQDIPVREIFVSEWDSFVRVRALNGAERDAYEAEIYTGEGKNRRLNPRNVRAKLIVRCVVDERGEPLFTPGDVEELGKKNAAALEKLFDVARELSGLAENDIEELLKNSESGQPGASPSA